MSETRYMVVWNSWEEKKRIARGNGKYKNVWDGVDESMVSDYTEPEDGECQAGPYSSLGRAFLRAKQLLPADSYGQVTIYKEARDKHGLWDGVCAWYVCHDTRQVKVAEPDHTYDCED